MFYSIPNLRTTAAVPVEKPWELPPADKIAGMPKDQMIAWGSDFRTKHHFISMYEGMSAGMRIGEDNGPFKMHGLVVDYDGNMPDDAAKFVEENPVCEFMPNWFVQTHSGSGRLVWTFETPLMLINERQTKEFLKLIRKKMSLDKWLPGLDAGAFGSPSRYFELGRKWEPVEKNAVIPKVITESWLLQASQELRFEAQNGIEYEIPIEDLAEAVEEKYPGRWQGEFTIGARGVRFWDADADNETGAVVRPDGMQCFTGGQAFVPWKQIFGSAFVEQYEANRIAGIVDQSAYDGRSFWVDGGGGRWQEWSKDDFSQELRCRGYNSRKKASQNASEVDMIENTIKRERRVVRALPFLFYPTGVISYMGKHYLNTSTVKPISPAPPFKERMTFSHGREHFPYIYKFLSKVFDPENGVGQLEAFLAWLQFFYVNSLNGTPRPGQAIVMAGNAGIGKTCLNKLILGGLMGGYCDASSHLVEGDQWTERLVDSPIMGIDDGEATGDYRSLVKFTNRLKKYVANHHMVYNQKFKASGEVPWFGRPVITCNLDMESMRIIPSMDMSTREKFSLFLLSDKNRMKFLSLAENEKKIRQELPNFARFLVDWDTPQDLLAEETRFGVKPYHNEELFEVSREQGISGMVLELLIPFLRDYSKSGTRGDVPGAWQGTASELHADLSAHNEAIMKEVKIRGLSTALGILNNNGYSLSKSKKNGLNTWTINFDLTAGAIEEQE